MNMIVFEDFLSSCLNADINKLKQLMQVQRVGSSFDDRPIYGFRWGSGDKRILVWNHTNSPEYIGTKSLLNLFHILNGSNTEVISAGKLIKWKADYSLYFIPILNPDGVTRNTQLNAMGIDILNDAKSLISPEIQVLDECINQFKPELVIGLNQLDSVSRVSSTKEVTSLAFSDPSKYMKSERVQTLINLVCGVYENLTDIHQKHIAINTKCFDSRSIGVVLGKHDIPTLQFSVGGRKTILDSKKSESVTTATLIELLKHYNNVNNKSYTVADFQKIPSLTNEIVDELHINAQITAKCGKRYKADVALNKSDKGVQLLEIGDLRNYEAYDTYNNSNFLLEELLQN
jgi:hypothetical protein